MTESTRADTDTTDTEGRPPTDEPERLLLRIGFSAALSGVFSLIDEPLLKGMEFAATQINAETGPIEVQIVSTNHGGVEELAEQSIEGLLSEGVEVFVLTSSDRGRADGIAISRAGGVVALGANTRPGLLSDISARAFGLIFTDNVQAAAAAEYACDNGYRTAYLIGSDHTRFTRTFAGTFSDEYRASTGESPSSGYEAIGRDYVFTLAEAARNAHSVEPDALLEAVLSLRTLPLLTGTVSMDKKKRVPLTKVDLVQIDGGAVTLRDQIVPTYVAPAIP